MPRRDARRCLSVVRAPQQLAHFPDFEHSLPMLLLRAREAVMERFRPMLRDFDLTEQQWRVLRALAEVEQSDASELAAASYILAPSLTRILQNLERRGLIARRTSMRDQRRAWISLTKQGRHLFGRVTPHSEARYRSIAEIFSSRRLHEISDLLEALRTQLEEDAKSASISATATTLAGKTNEVKDPRTRRRSAKQAAVPRR